MSEDQAGDIVSRLREWSADDMDTHAVLCRNGVRVADVPWCRHGTDLGQVLFEAAETIERLRAEAIPPGWANVEA